MKRALDTNMELQNLLVEINGSRFAHNVSLSEVNFSVIKALTMMPVKSNNNIMSELSTSLKYFHLVIKNYIKGPPDIDDCLRALEVSLKRNPFNSYT